MPYRRTHSEDDVSLFPFLSIIACVIGVLTMMIATLALAQTDTPDVAQVEAYEKTQREVRQAERQIESLQTQLEASQSSALEIRDQQAKLEITIEELEKLLAEIERIDQELAEQQKAKVVIPTLDESARETLLDLRAQQQRLQADLERMRADIVQRVDASQATVTVLPQGTGLNFVPYFVECAEGAVVMHHLPQPKRIRAGDITTDADFQALLERVANSTNGTIVFLLRSDGLAVYQACKRLCDERQIRNGKLPVVGQGTIDLSAFAGPQ